MYAPAQQKALDMLAQYLSETPVEIIAAEIKEVAALDFEGDSITHYFDTFTNHYLHTIPQDSNVILFPFGR